MDHPVSLEALAVLDAVERHGSFAAAAEAMHRVPSAVTYSIRKLEEDLGLELFDRSGHRAQLTAAGRLVLDRGRALLLASSDLKTTARRLATGWEPRVGIALNTIIEGERLLPLLCDFHDQQPGIELVIIEEVLGGVWDALASERALLAIGAPGDVPRGFATLTFGPAEFVYVAAPDHPAAQLPTPVDPAALAEYTGIVATDSSRLLQPRSAGMLDLSRQIGVPNMSWKIMAHEAGLGVGYAPRHRVRAALAEGRLVEIALTEQRAPEPLAIAWSRKHSGRALRWFIDRLGETDLDALLLS